MVADGGVPPLTERDLQVLRGMGRGRSNSEIGKELYLSEDTVKTHARRLFRIKPRGYSTTMLTATPPPVKDTPDDIIPWLRSDNPRTHAPRLAASFAELRTMFNKNTVHRTVKVLQERNEVVVGTLDTGKAGRPPRAVGLANEPLPMTVDGLPVKWQS